jgi:hypothetical protein
MRQKTRKINESRPAFGSARDEANAKKSISAFLDSVEQKNDQAKLTYIQNRLTTITKNLVKLPKNPESGEIAVSAAREAIDVLSPEFFEKFFGELKQAYPDQINFTPQSNDGPPEKAVAPAPTKTAAAPALEAKYKKLQRLIREYVKKELKKYRI